MKRDEWTRMQDEGIAWLESKGFKLLVKGGSLSSYDAILSKNGKQYIINVKSSSRSSIQKVFSVHFANLRSLVETYPTYIPCLLFVCNGEYYLFQYLPI